MSAASAVANLTPQLPASPTPDDGRIAGQNTVGCDTEMRTESASPSSSHPASSPNAPDGGLREPDASFTAPRSRSRSTLRLLQALKPTLTLENSGSVARDHLASERTWLAYVRTSLAVASTGVALVQLFTISASQSDVSDPERGEKFRVGESIQQFARPLGATTVLLGLVVLAIGVHRYFKIQSAMTQGQFPVARKTVAFITTILAALVAVTFSILVAVPRQS